MFNQAIPGLDQITGYLITAFILLIGLIILIVIVKVVLHFFLAIVGGVIVWYIAEYILHLPQYSLLLGAIGFLVVAIITTTGRKKPTFIHAGQSVGKVCPNCTLALSRDARYCPNCGRAV